MRTRDIKQWLSAADPAEAESPYDPDDDMAPENQVPVYSTQLEEAESGSGVMHSRAESDTGPNITY